MDAIQAVRELGKAIQADERYIEYARAKKVNDEDTELQNLIGEFNLIRQNAAMEYNKPEEEQNKEKLADLNAKMQEAYEKVMANENMALFTVAKAGMDELMGQVNTVLTLVLQGADPETCPTTQPTGCTGSCASCGGCG
ncbi:MAG: YlbF family regulator [Oscillospiraceae bacterium]|nr:YlbF family regulator [Oscillospiraceae bacterium]